MTNLAINFNFPAVKMPIRFKDIPEGPFMGYFDGAPTFARLQLKGRAYTYNLETNEAFYNGDYEHHFVYSYRPVHVTLIVNDAPQPEEDNDCL